MIPSSKIGPSRLDFIAISMREQLAYFREGPVWSARPRTIAAGRGLGGGQERAAGLRVHDR
jgi:hypothetical protein